MANMSYCRFENTLPDLRDCSHNLDDQLSGHEKAARRALLRLAAEMLKNIGGDHRRGRAGARHPDPRDRRVRKAARSGGPPSPPRRLQR